MAESRTPIADLFSALGKDPSDKITLGMFSATSRWQNAQVPLAAADAYAQAMTAQGLNVYHMVNDIGRELEGNQRGEAKDVTRLNALWADLDFKDGGLDGEATARAVIDSLSGLVNSPPTAVVHTGGGLHPYWAVDPDESRIDKPEDFTLLLRRWGALVKAVAGGFGGSVDSVYDLPRVLRSPGTLNHKTGTPRPTSIEFPQGSHEVTQAEMVDAFEAYGIPAILSGNEGIGEVVAPLDTWPVADTSCVWVTSLIDQITNLGFEARHPAALAMAIKVAAHARYGCFTKDDYEQTMNLVRDKFLYSLAHGENPREPAPREFEGIAGYAIRMVSSWDAGRTSHEVNNHPHNTPAPAELGKESGSDEPATPVTEAPAAVVAAHIEAIPMTDNWNAEKFSHEHKGQFLFVPGLGWLTWQNNRYEVDERASVHVAARRFINRIPTFLPGVADAMKWAKKSSANSAIKAMLEMASHNEVMVRTVDELDRNAYELVTPTGIVNLRDGSHRTGDPLVDFNTKSTAFGPAAGTPKRWLDFLRFTFSDRGEDGAEEMIQYLQDILGAALVGEVRWQFLPMFVGKGANGKSTLLEVIIRILGSYARAMPENFLLEGNQQHLTELANLQAVRFATASETRPDGTFNESRVKMLTGGDMISARKMRQDLYQFRPSHSLFVALNHKPQVKAGGDGFWRRMRIINFGVQVPDGLRNDNLVNDIVDADGPQILQWLIEGAKRIIANGETTPSHVLKASYDYQYEEDQIANFIAENIAVDPEAAVYKENLMNAYRAWCMAEHQTALTGPQFSREMFQRLSSLRNTRDASGARMIAGIALINKSIQRTELFDGTRAEPGSSGLPGEPGYEPRLFGE